jgi:hypothetical protein
MRERSKRCDGIEQVVQRSLYRTDKDETRLRMAINSLLIVSENIIYSVVESKTLFESFYFNLRDHTATNGLP